MSELAATNDIAAVPARPTGGAGTRLPAGLTGVVQQAQAFIAQPAVQKSLPALGMMALAGLALLIWMVMSAPPSRTLFTGLADEEKAAVVEALRSSGTAYSIDPATGAITVSESDYHQARMQLAAQGLPRGGADGSDVIESLPLGASRAVETERIRTSRELDLARTIEGIDAVQAARVHLAVETPSVFVRNRAAPSASVMLTLVPGRTLGEGQIQAIVHLVSSSVPNLAPDGVSVVDQNGRLLSREGASGAASERQLAVQTAIEDRYRQALSSLLTPILGAGNFTAEVHADVDFSEIQSTREGFPEDARALRSEESQLSTDGAARAAGGIPGALSNQPPAAAEVAAAPDGAVTPTPAEAPAEAMGGRRTENVVRNFALGREVSVTRQQSPQVRRLTVAVALRHPEGAQPRNPAEIQALEQLVKGAVGFDQGRGDVVALSARPFAPVAEPEPSWWEAGWIPMIARNLTAIVLALLLVFGLGRPLLKKGSAMLQQRAENQRRAKAQVGSEIAAAIATQASTDPSSRVTIEMIEASRDYEARAALIRTFVRQDPARAALVVRDLIRTDAKNGADRNG